MVDFYQEVDPINQAIYTVLICLTVALAWNRLIFPCACMYDNSNFYRGEDW